MSKNLLFAFVAALVAGLFGYALGRNTDFSLKIQSEDKSVSVNVKGKSVNYKDVLEATYKDEFLRGAAKQWLLEKHSIVEVTDQRLASTIEKKACPSIPQQPLDAKLAALQKCADVPANQQLRDLALIRRGYPFHPVGRKTKMTVPDPPTVPGEGEAAVCDLDLLGKKIEVYYQKLNTSIYVKATEALTCSSFADSPTQLHLNPANAKELLRLNNPVGIHTVYVIER